MLTGEQFHSEFIEAARALVDGAISGEDINDWDKFIEPFFRKVVDSVKAGFVADEFSQPVVVGTMPRNPETDDDIFEATVTPCLILFPNDDSAEVIEGAAADLSEVMLGSWGECRRSAMSIILAVERSCKIARVKLAAKDWK